MPHKKGLISSCKLKVREIFFYFLVENFLENAAPNTCCIMQQSGSLQLFGPQIRYTSEWIWIVNFLFGSHNLERKGFADQSHKEAGIVPFSYKVCSNQKLVSPLLSKIIIC